MHLRVNSTDLKGAVAWGERHLKEAGIDAAQLDSRLLLCCVTGYSRTELILHLDDKLSETEWEDFQQLVKKRASGFPLQYILGRCDFYNISLKVSPGVFIPRPETEILVEEVLTFFKGKSEALLLDVGTGSGAIAVALARNLPNPKIIATDISPYALKIARENATDNNVADRVFFLGCDLFDSLKEGDGVEGRFDGIVSNPPYIAYSEKETLPKEVRDFEPPEALFAEDGLFFHRRIIEDAPIYLKPGGLLALEVALGKASEVRDLISSGPSFGSARIREDLAGRRRVVCSVRN